MPNLADPGQIIEERDQALAEVARLKARLDAKARTESRGVVTLDILKEAAHRILECVTSPNPYSEPTMQLRKAAAHLEYALAVNGSQVLEFEVVSDKN